MGRNIGDFLQDVRKSRGITQKELADQIGISDKTISKWENGNSVPDASILLPLCNALEITVNELLSCEKIPPEDYSVKAEENMLELIRENKLSKCGNFIAKIIGIIVFCFGLLYITISNAGMNFILGNYIDFPGIIIDVALVVGAILASGARTKEAILHLLGKILIPVGLIVFIGSEFVALYYFNADGNSPLAINTAVAALPMLYSLIAKVIVELLITRE